MFYICPLPSRLSPGGSAIGAAAETNMHVQTFFQEDIKNKAAGYEFLRLLSALQRADEQSSLLTGAHLVQRAGLLLELEQKSHLALILIHPAADTLTLNSLVLLVIVDHISAFIFCILFAQIVFLTLVLPVDQ